MNNTHVKQFTEKKNAEIHLHTAGALQKYNQALEVRSRAAFEEVLPKRQKSTWNKCFVTATCLQQFFPSKIKGARYIRVRVIFE